MIMDSFIIYYISQRMNSIGFTRFVYEPIMVIMPEGQQEYVIEGVNEYYYLTSRVLAAGIEIEADNNYFKADESYVNLDYSRFQEFTGQIKIKTPGGKIAIEFIRVIPQITITTDQP
jgi:hypothetical protein